MTIEITILLSKEKNASLISATLEITIHTLASDVINSVISKYCIPAHVPKYSLYHTTTHQQQQTIIRALDSDECIFLTLFHSNYPNFMNYTRFQFYIQKTIQDSSIYLNIRNEQLSNLPLDLLYKRYQQIKQNEDKHIQFIISRHNSQISDIKSRLEMLGHNPDALKKSWASQQKSIDQNLKSSTATDSKRDDLGSKLLGFLGF